MSAIFCKVIIACIPGDKGEYESHDNIFRKVSEKTCVVLGQSCIDLWPEDGMFKRLKQN